MCVATSIKFTSTEAFKLLKVTSAPNHRSSPCVRSMYTIELHGKLIMAVDCNQSSYSCLAGITQYGFPKCKPVFKEIAVKSRKLDIVIKKNVTVDCQCAEWHCQSFVLETKKHSLNSCTVSKRKAESSLSDFLTPASWMFQKYYKMLNRGFNFHQFWCLPFARVTKRARHSLWPPTSLLSITWSVATFFGGKQTNPVNFVPVTWIPDGP